MTDYEGVWGMALIDLDCASSITVRPDHAQYPASAGKIVLVVAALRAVQDGLLEFSEVEEHIDLVLWHSLDKNTDAIAELVTPEQVAEVVERAGLSEQSRVPWQWRFAWFTPHDLALVWASIVRGEQLEEEWTTYLLHRASEVVLPVGYETFPAEFGAEGYQYGQKAGYWLPEDEPARLVSAGYARPLPGEGASESAGFTFAFLVKTWAEELDFSDPQRGLVFPLVRDFMVAEMAARTR